MPLLEEVFKLSGVPTYTFVPPNRYEQMKVSVRTPGRCMVVEGPSGIGKTTCVTKIFDDLGVGGAVTKLSARKAEDVEYIEALPSMGRVGLVMVDDFHRLQDATKAKLADYVKVLADEGSGNSKIILIGINKAGDRLVQYGDDVGLRVDVFKLEANPPELVERMVEQGESALNVSIGAKKSVVDSAQGSFQIAQMLCHQLCIEGKATESKPETNILDVGLESVMDEVLVTLKRMFQQACIEFAQGSKLRKEGRAPYLHILLWLRDSADWSVDLRRALRDHPEHRGSVGQVVTKGYLETLLKDKAAILDTVFHYQPETKIFTVEDPRVVFYLRRINWKNFVREIGFSVKRFRGKYDVALSFAGADRDTAKALFDKLTEREVSVFYDEDEQHRILAEKLEDYLGPIYASEAAYVVPLLGPDYPTRIWTRFESNQFKGRFGEKAVIAVRFTTARDGFFSEAHEYGSLSFDPSGDVDSQLNKIVETVAKRLEDDRFGEEAEEPVDAATEELIKEAV
jgi:hypothetical protein